MLNWDARMTRSHVRSKSPQVTGEPARSQPTHLVGYCTIKVANDGKVHLRIRILN